MPIYEYSCPPCQILFERMRPMDAFDEPADCPDCGIPSPRVLSMFSAITKSPGGEMMPVGVTSGGCDDGHDVCGCGDVGSFVC